jgi:hypothetical protein
MQISIVTLKTPHQKITDGLCIKNVICAIQDSLNYDDFSSLVECQLLMA